MVFRSLFLSAVVAAAGLSASAADVTYSLDQTKFKAATSITTALDWNTAANWSSDVGGVPNAGNAFAYISPAAPANAYSYVTSGIPITVARIGYSGAGYIYRSVYVSDQPLTMTAHKYWIGGSPGGIYIYAPTVIPAYTNAYFHYMALCGPVSFGTKSLILGNYGATEFRLDRWADSNSATRVNPYGADAGELSSSGTTLRFAAPESSAEPVTGSYKVTAGSPYAFRASGSQHALAVGTAVTCAGVLPDGTYLKRLFPDRSIELSQAATNTSASATLTFAAFTPNVRQTFSKFSLTGTDPFTLILNKYREEDTFVIEMPISWGLNASGSITTDSSRQPGLLSTHGFRTAGVSSKQHLTLKRCELEFVPETGKDSIVDNAYFDQAAGCVSGISVPEGKTADLRNVSSWAGTFVKRDAGALKMNVISNSLGKLEVLAGSCALTVPDGAGALQSLTVAAGAELVVPASGLSTDTATFEAGAIVSGGTLTVVGMKNPLNPGIVCRDGAKVVYAYDPQGQDVIHACGDWTTLPPTLRSQAAFWVDADLADSMVTETVDSKTYVSRVNDVRGTGYNFATNVVNRPTLVGSLGNRRMIRFRGRVVGGGECSDVTVIDTLLWARPIPNIRYIFQVYERGTWPAGSLTGGGWYLGTSSRVTMSRFVRSTDGKWTTAIFHSTAPACVKNGTFRMLDQIYPALERGMGYITESPSTADPTFYPDKTFHAPFVTSFETAPDYLAADNFDWDQGAVGRYGQKDLCELIVFTNEVSVADRQSITAYLAKKWNKCELATFRPSNPDGETFGTATVAGDMNVSVAAGGSVMVSNVVGTATLNKEGDGTLYVPEYVNADGKLHVKGGTLEIEAQRLTKADLPEGAFIHLDATDLTTSTTVVEGDKTNVTAWADVRGAGYPKATIYRPASTWKPYLRANALNGLPVVDFGEYVFETTSTGPATSPRLNFSPVTNGMHSLFAVWGSRNGGGCGLAGCGGYAYNQGMGLTHGSAADGRAEAGDPIIRATSHYPSFSGSDGYGYAYRFRLNGVACDPTVATFSGNFDLISLVSYVGFGMTALSGGGLYGYATGGEEIGEYIVYERALSDANAKLVEAYLRKKWYNADTPGLRAPVAGDVTVDAGATLKLRGAAPLTVSSFKCAGTVDGSVACAASAVIEVTVNDDGSVTPSVLTGTLDLSAGATIRLVGATGKLQTGSWPVVTTTGITSGALSLEADGVRKGRKLTLAVDGTSLVLTVTRRGVAVFVR